MSGFSRTPLAHGSADHAEYDCFDQELHQDIPVAVLNDQMSIARRRAPHLSLADDPR